MPASPCEQCASHAAFARSAGATAYLISPPDELRERPEELTRSSAGSRADAALPLIVQDLDWAGPGLALETIERLREALPQMAGIKVESVPAGPKYTRVREPCGPEFHISAAGRSHR